MSHTVLELNGISLNYGVVQALQDVSLTINNGEIVTLLGANGAGKSSLLRAISRLETISAGEIVFKNHALHKTAPEKIVALGLAHCPEGRRVFPEMTVGENLAMGAYLQSDPEIIAQNLQMVFDYFPVLSDRQKQSAGTLSGGEQQMLAVGRSLMSSPNLLMLDEPSLGLAPKFIDQIFNIITRINRDNGVTIFLVEQNANEALLHADRGYVLENGRITLVGSASDLRKDPRVIEAYLGI